ncbi:hypothetical protein BU23DRAFT_598779 [Bimuria novae-zelandiae CBS 107.79]|uniref:Uncharacterized protein n=1 Tax=Bimuria novae-zelandiae CBS 107.79 TaxID=1447943 RepID=A0A6A5V919_9PLEO|nr:hypothetical protein BU23DRAFT_598779 [Bimuria novae-zelandiae CBS 107.79]
MEAIFHNVPLGGLIPWANTDAARPHKQTQTDAVAAAAFHTTETSSESQVNDVREHLSAMSKHYPASSSAESYMPERQDIHRIMDIPDSAYKQLLLEAVDHDNKFTVDDCINLRHTGGSYNHVAILELNKIWYAIKVPLQGTPELWKEADALELRSEVFMMKYLRKHTSIPIMEVFKFETTLDNSIGAPYMIQAGAKGIPAQQCFLALDDDYEIDRVANEHPSAALEKRRRTFLRDLASKMAELRKFEFNKSGMFYFEDDSDMEDAKPPTVGPYFELLFSTEARPAYSSTREFLGEKIQQWTADQEKHIEDKYPEDSPTKLQKIMQLKGAVAFLDCALLEFPGLPHPEEEDEETFVLNHPDLDFQNILVHPKSGLILSIIDWQGIRAVPRPIGYSSLPLFLRKDWEPNYDLDIQLPPWILDKYRDMYTDFMKEALGPDNDDAAYTRHSYWHWYAYEQIAAGDSSISDFIDRIMTEIPFLSRLDRDDFLARLGSGDWDSAQEMLLLEFQKLCNPHKYNN